MGKARLLKLQSRLGVRARPSEERLKTMSLSAIGLNREAEAIPEGEGRLTKSDQEMSGDPKVRLERISKTYHGITYEGRPLG